MGAPTPSHSPHDGRTWPELPFEEWKDTCATLHMWTQIVGKIRRSRMPWINHSWHVPLYLTARGMTTSPIPCDTREFELEFDFVDHHLHILTGDAGSRIIELRPRSVADFYRELFAHLGALGFDVRIHAIPNEIPDVIPFEQDHAHASYDAEYANRFWRILTQVNRVLQEFRADFIGKCSPVHFFWGGFDLAVTRFSGRTAPRHPGGIPNCPDWIMREAYSHELSSCGFWPGNDALPYPAFYAYAYPEPPGFNTARVQPGDAGYNTMLGEFILPYAAVRQSPSPDATLLAFLQSTYDAASDLGKWDRAALERPLSGSYMC